jgi:hypothetical protein
VLRCPQSGLRCSAIHWRRLIPQFYSWAGAHGSIERRASPVANKEQPLSI